MLASVGLRLPSLTLLTPPPCKASSNFQKWKKQPSFAIGFSHKIQLRCNCQQSLIEKSTELNFYQKKYYDMLQNNDENLAMVGLDSIQEANFTVENFCRSYFMFHGLDLRKPQSIFKYLPILYFIDSYIYQLDTLNEKLVQMESIINGESALGGKEKETQIVLTYGLPDDPFRPLLTALEHKGLLTERIREELIAGAGYWALERRLCQALVNNEEINIEDVMKAMHLKSTDYRVMNLIIYKLRGEKVNELHMEFFSVSEFLWEITDDLRDYEDDILENNFNVLRMFTRIYGPSNASGMLTKCIIEAEEKYDCLLKLLDPQLALSYQKRCEEETNEGGRVSGHFRDNWNIPNVIADENLYRSSKHISNI